ncbi:uncharacterized protein Z518_03811 [Rhinocladiella mackenziei CBS 650.93]|uniref:Ubiquitin carboxyl-terminal hydrolase 19 n=1 Tax=Rhinocladiella mackenziei CBS 650.93 TaxID=1442369 RepID=A0A0D2H5Z7_9EURO|nr:uncharacterized protein Z518_03811 [Rhinocladiella mackenziei CBS 650.93]KIX05838.1 hypothetical protein Z518_03811 [Rhinocladiella mackenziei CBS 650.93]
MESREFATRDELWRIQTTLNELSATQALHSDRIMRLEQKTPDGSRSRSLWGSTSPFPGVLGSSHHESTLNPAAEAFRNFDVDPGTSMMSSLTLDTNDDSRRAAASRANSVRFDESANNHYGSSRQSMELPTRTGSGLGGHALSERSLSHRSDGRPTGSGFGRTNSFGLEQSRLLGSIHNSPRVSGNPPPGFFVLGPCPSIIRCWLTPSFSNDSLLYAAVCSGSSVSSVSFSLVGKLGLTDSIFDDGESRAVRLPVYLTEAKIHSPAVRSASPVPQIPTLTVKFIIDEQPVTDPSIQIILGSDVLRSHNADILFSQDKLMIFDEERNQLSIPLVRPEDDASYKDLCTASRKRSSSMEAVLPPPASPIGVIGRPGRLGTAPGVASPTVAPSSSIASATPSEPGDMRRIDQGTDPSTRSSLDLALSRPTEDSKSTTGSEKSFTTPMSKVGSGVWSNSWRSVSSSAQNDSSSKPTASSYARPSSSRPMKVLRPGKTMANATRATSSSATTSNGAENASTRSGEEGRKSSQLELAGESKASHSASTTKTNPIGSGTAFGWLNAGPQRRTTANG